MILNLNLFPGGYGTLVLLVIAQREDVNEEQRGSQALSKMLLPYKRKHTRLGEKQTEIRGKWWQTI